MRTLVVILSAVAVTAAVVQVSVVAGLAPAPPAAASRGRGAPAAAAQAAGVRTVATVKQLMHAIVIPASDAVFEGGGEPPKTDAAWDAIETKAIALAESGNLLMVGTRPVDRLDWMKMSRAMVDASAGAVNAARKKDAAALSAASDAVYETCAACHAKYMKQ